MTLRRALSLLTAAILLLAVPFAGLADGTRLTGTMNLDTGKLAEAIASFMPDDAVSGDSLAVLDEIALLGRHIAGFAELDGTSVRLGALVDEQELFSVTLTRDGNDLLLAGSLWPGHLLTVTVDEAALSRMPAALYEATVRFLDSLSTRAVTERGVFSG